MVLALLRPNTERSLAQRSGLDRYPLWCRPSRAAGTFTRLFGIPTSGRLADPKITVPVER